MRSSAAIYLAKYLTHAKRRQSMEDRITSLPYPELVVAGVHLRAPQLLQQANYTIALARGEGDALATRMAPGFVDKVDAVYSKVAKAFEDKTVSAADAKMATGTQ